MIVEQGMGSKLRDQVFHEDNGGTVFDKITHDRPFRSDSARDRQRSQALIMKRRFVPRQYSARTGQCLKSSRMLCSKTNSKKALIHEGCGSNKVSNRHTLATMAGREVGRLLRKRIANCQYSGRQFCRLIDNAVKLTGDLPRSLTRHVPRHL